MTTHDEKILQLLDRIHATAQGRREQTVDGAVQAMERVNRTSYGALRDLTENGNKKKGPVVRAWQAQELLVDDDGLVSSVPAAPIATAPAAMTMAANPQVPASAETGVDTAEITQVMAFATAEPTVVTPAPKAFEPNATTSRTLATRVPPKAAAPAPAVHPERLSEPDEVVSGDGATYHGAGSAFQQTQVIWFRRLFRRR